MCYMSAENGPFVSHLTHLLQRAVVLSLGLGLLLFDIDLKWNEMRLDDGTGTTKLGSKGSKMAASGPML